MAGLIPHSTLSGSPWSDTVRQYAVDASNDTAIFVGDVIAIEADGNVTPAAAAESLVSVGVCVGVKPDRAVAATEHPGYLPATTAGNVFVCTGRDVLYTCEEDGTGNTVTATEGYANFEIVPGTGSTTTGKSGTVIDSSSAATTAALPLKGWGLAPIVGNAVGTASGSDGATKWLVSLNESIYQVGAAGVQA